MDWQFIADLFKGVFLFSGNITQSILAYAGILSFIYLLFPGLEGKMKDRLSILRDHKLNILLVFLLISILITSYNLYENKQINFATPDALLSSELDNQNIRLSDLTRENITIRSKTFNNCDIYGPAIIAITGPIVVKNPIFEFAGGTVNDGFIIVNDKRWITGAITFDSCIFNDCHFHGIGIIATEEQYQKIIASMNTVVVR